MSMDSVKRASVLIDLTDALRRKGSWAGETHLQKATYLLQEMLGVDLGLSYSLYKHGPFSFDLRDELNRMVVDELLELEPRPPYGPSLAVTETGASLMRRFSNTVMKNHEAVTFVADAIGSDDVFELERVATAFYLARQEPSDSDESLARRLHALKPHVSVESALAGVERVKQLLVAAPDASTAASG
jgi:uncharacterized protein YwgA